MIFGYYVVPISIFFKKVFLRLAAGSGYLNNLTARLLDLVSRLNVIRFFFNLSRGG